MTNKKQKVKVHTGTPILVKDLIAALSKCDQDAEIILSEDYLFLSGVRHTETMLGSSSIKRYVELLVEKKKVTREVYRLIGERIESVEDVINDPREYLNRNPVNQS